MDELVYKILREKIEDLEKDNRVKEQVMVRAIDEKCELEKELKEVKRERDVYKIRDSQFDAYVMMHRNEKMSYHPIKVFYHKGRKHTTVLFSDGSSMTVKRSKGDKHCLHTAVVYAIVKKLFPKKLIEELVEGAEIKGGRRCKKKH